MDRVHFSRAEIIDRLVRLIHQAKAAELVVIYNGLSQGCYGSLSYDADGFSMATDDLTQDIPEPR